MKYNTIIFDLDGTISNTESGIFKAFRKMMKEFGVDESKFDLKKFIGPPIQWSFYQIFGDDMRLFKALDYFRGEQKCNNLFHQCFLPFLCNVIFQFLPSSADSIRHSRSPS